MNLTMAMRINAAIDTDYRGNKWPHRRIGIPRTLVTVKTRGRSSGKVPSMAAGN
jgi:hypothetical protein